MKKILPFFIVSAVLTLHTHAQSCSATISASGPTTFCSGGSVVLTANAPLSFKKTDFSGGARGLAASFSIGSKAYVGTGYDRTYKNDFWEYDPAANTWTQKADFGGAPRGYATGLSIGSKGYIGTGTNSTTLKDFWEYDPAANTWTRKADFGGTARINASGFTVGTKGYIGTGLDVNGTYTKDVWEYNPATNSWVRKADFGGTGRYAAASFVAGTKAYLGTGVATGAINTKDFWEYDPSTNAWLQKADFGGMERFGANGFLLGGNGFIGNGHGDTNLRDFWEYNPSTDVWTRRADFGGTPREYSISFSTGTKAYVGTGIDNNGFTADLWQYDPTTTYMWSTGETTPEITVTTSGNYTVTITNTALGCTATSAPVTVTVNQSTFADTTAAVCNMFTWHGITYKASGDYTYVTTNQAGCDSTTTLHLTIQSIHSTFSKTDATCFGFADGSIIITPTNGVYPFTYRIGTIQPFVSDSTFTGLKAGKYRITIYDATGCAGVSDQITLSQLPAITYSFATTDALCNNSPTGSFYINATSGVAPFKYKFGTTGIYDSVNSFANLRGGNYRVTIKDAMGCIKTTDIITVGQPPQVRATYTKTNETCPNQRDGSINLIDSIGVSPFVYKFGTTGVYSSTHIFTGLRAANYRIFVRDANNCEGQSLLIPILQICSTQPSLERAITQNKTMAHGQIKIYPNPTTGRSILNVNAFATGKAEISIINEQGVMVQQQTVTLQPYENHINIDLQRHAPGIYLVKVLTEQGVQTTKVLVIGK